MYSRPKIIYRLFFSQPRIVASIFSRLDKNYNFYFSPDRIFQVTKKKGFLLLEEWGLVRKAALRLAHAYTLYETRSPKFLSTVLDAHA